MSLLAVSSILEARGDFYNKVRGAVVTVAAEIYQEDPATANHTERRAWASDCLLNANYEGRTKELYRLALTLPSVITGYDSLTDEAILQGVRDLLPRVLGV